MEELYHQITLDEWINMKEDLNRELLGVSQSFVRIGYKLRRIKDQELFRNDGCESITEWGQKELGLNATAVSRFMRINEKYSVDGYSEMLLPEYQGFGYGKLGEMLTLPDEDMAMVRPEMSKKDIQELKRFNKEQPKDENDIRDLIRHFWEKNVDLLKEVNFDDDLDELTDQINPSGNRSHKKGMLFMTMYENEIMIKRYGGTPETMTWEQFIEISRETAEEIPEEEPEQAAEPEPEKEADEKPFAPAQMPDFTDKTQDQEAPEPAPDFMPKPEQIEQKPESDEQKPEPDEQKLEQIEQEADQNDQEVDHTDTEKPEETPDETETETENEAAAAVTAEIVEEEETESAESTENTDQEARFPWLDFRMKSREMDLAVEAADWAKALELAEWICRTLKEVQDVSERRSL